MHRAFGRALRGTCRKWRENECPVVAGEEVRKKKDDDNKKDFTPPKHTWEEAVTWTAGLVLGYQLSHHRRCNQVLLGEHPATQTSERYCTNKIANSDPPKNSSSSCPFAVSSKVLTQPIFNLGTSLNVKSRTSTTVIQSIDVAPFIQDYNQESELPGNDRLSSTSDDDDDDGIVFADELSSEPIEVAQQSTKANVSSVPSTSTSTSAIDSAVEYGRRFSGDLLSVLGAFEFLKAEDNAKAPATTKSRKKLNKKKNGVFGKNPPIHALDLMQKGADLGSGRALYNIGVAYDRMKDMKVAREYYKRAADLGHPLATYNCAVLALKDGCLTEGYALMKTASEIGVLEAISFMNPQQDEGVTPQFQNLQVGNA